jgi:hypothetical protein
VCWKRPHKSSARKVAPYKQGTTAQNVICEKFRFALDEGGVEYAQSSTKFKECAFTLFKKGRAGAVGVSVLGSGVQLWFYCSRLLRFYPSVTLFRTLP